MVKGMTKCFDETVIVTLRSEKRLLKINEMFWKKNYQRIGRLCIFLPVETHLFKEQFWYVLSTIVMWPKVF